MDRMDPVDQQWVLPEGLGGAQVGWAEWRSGGTSIGRFPNGVRDLSRCGAAAAIPDGVRGSCDSGQGVTCNSGYAAAAIPVGG